MSSQQAARLSKWMPRVTVGLILLACWLANHPYIGIAHDARLYSVQALSRLLPGLFSNDLFFMPGSQESFTLFSHLWAPLIGRWGLGTTALVLLVVAHALWLWGAVRLVRVLFEQRVDRYLALAGLFVLPPDYGGINVFHYGEGFLTPRIFVEAIILHALAWTVAGRGAMALAAVSISALLHPLCAATGALVIWVRLCFGNRRWLLLGAGAASAAVALALAGVSPLDRLLRSFDDDWLRVLHQRTPFAFPAEWSWSNWDRTLLQFGLVASAAVWSQRETRRFLQSALMASGITLMVAFVATAALKNVLVSQLQVWRSLWILSALANAATGYLISAIWRGSPNRVPLICLLAITWCWAPFPEVSMPLLFVTSALFVWQWQHPAHALPRPAQWIVCAATGMTVGCVMALDVFIQMNQIQVYSGKLRGLIVGMGWMGVLEWFLFGLCVFAWTRRGRAWKPALSLILAGSAFLITLLAWDRRGYWQHWIETHDRTAVPFDSILMRNEQVLWLDGFAETWILLRRPSYFSHEQGAGALFSRETALRFKARADSLNRLDPRENLLFTPLNRRLGPPPVVTSDTLTYTCNSVSGLDSIVSATNVPGRARMVWHAPVSRIIRRWSGKEWFADTERDFYLYPCSDFRQPPLAQNKPEKQGNPR